MAAAYKGKPTTIKYKQTQLTDMNNEFLGDESEREEGKKEQEDIQIFFNLLGRNKLTCG